MHRQLFEYHPVIGCRFIPCLKARVDHEGGGYLVRVNREGFRCDHDFEVEKKNGVRRLLLFGDSFTAGDGVSNGKRYGDLLENMVPGLEVFNFGLPGTGTDQHYLAYQEYGVNIDHDVAVIAALVENIRRVAARFRVSLTQEGEKICMAKPYYELENGSLVLKNSPPSKTPVPFSEMPADLMPTVDMGGRFPVLGKFVRKVGMHDVIQKITRYQPVPEYNRPGNPTWRIMSSILREWIGRLPGKVLLVPLPLHQHIEEIANPRPYQQRFKELAGEAGAVLHDPLPDLLSYEMRQRRSFRFSQDVHLTPAGHQALAQSIAPPLKKMLDDGDMAEVK